MLSVLSVVKNDDMNHMGRSGSHRLHGPDMKPCASLAGVMRSPCNATHHSQEAGLFQGVAADRDDDRRRFAAERKGSGEGKGGEGKGRRKGEGEGKGTHIFMLHGLSIRNTVVLCVNHALPGFPMVTAVATTS